MIKKAKIFLKSILPRDGWLLIFFIIISVIAFSVLAFPIALRPALFTLKQGDVSQQDICLLYTSDAADELLCVDLGGRRLIKNKHTSIIS